VWPIGAKVDLPDFRNPVMKIDIAADVKLDTLELILSDKFKIDIPACMTGRVS